MTDLDAIKGRVRNAYLLDRDDGDALESAMGDVKALVAEVERLRAEAHELRLMVEEAARAENLNAEDAKRERAAVVTFLREQAEWEKDGAGWAAMNHASVMIERGLHRHEEK